MRPLESGLPAVRGSPVRWSLKRDEAVWGWLFALPAALFFAVFWVYPVASVLYTSLTDWDLFTPPRFIGLDNYRVLLGDPDFHQAVRATLYYGLASAVPIVVLSLGLALMLDRKFRGRALFRTAIFVPAVTSWIVSSIVWKMIFLPSDGLYLLFVEPFGVHEIRWLTSRDLAMPAIVIVAVWKSVGPNMVLFLAGLQNLPDEYFEAARVDGASDWQVLAYMTLPLLRPTLVFVLVTLMIGALNMFTPMYVMTRGGPADATRVVPLYMYQEAFAFHRMGRASAVSVLMLAAILILTVAQLRLFNSAHTRDD